MIFAPPAGRLALIAGLILLGLTACGRRGSLEPPPDPAALAAEQRRAAARQQGGRVSPVSVPSSEARPAVEGEANPPGQAQVNDGGLGDEPGAESLIPTATPTGAGRRRRPFVIPKEPFILDPLL